MHNIPYNKNKNILLIHTYYIIKTKTKYEKNDKKKSNKK